MIETTPLLDIPMLHVGQAAKELTHNEALVLIEALLCGRAVDIASDPATLGPVTPGMLWIVDDAPVGDWLTRAGSLALMTAGGWRFIPPRNGLSLWLESEDTMATFHDGWQLSTPIDAIAASDHEDVGARAQLDALLDALVQKGVVRRPL